MNSPDSPIPMSPGLEQHRKLGIYISQQASFYFEIISKITSKNKQVTIRWHSVIMRWELDATPKICVSDVRHSMESWASSIEFPYHGVLSHHYPRAVGPPTRSWDLQEPDSRFCWWLSQGFCHSHRKLKNTIGWVKINYHLVRSDSRSSERNESNEFRVWFSDIIGSYSFNTVRYDTCVWDTLNMQKCKMQEEHWGVCVCVWGGLFIVTAVRWPQQDAGQEPGREPGRRALATCLLPCILIVQTPQRFIYWDLMDLFCHCLASPKCPHTLVRQLVLTLEPLHFCL